MEPVNGNLKDLVQVIAACKRAGVLRFKMGDMEILFADSDQINAGQLKINGNYDTISVGSSGDSVDSEVSPEDELEINEQNMDELILTDPLAFEHSLLEESNTDVREARQRQ